MKSINQSFVLGFFRCQYRLSIYISNRMVWCDWISHYLNCLFTCYMHRKPCFSSTTFDALSITKLKSLDFVCLLTSASHENSTLHLFIPCYLLNVKTCDVLYTFVWWQVRRENFYFLNSVTKSKTLSYKWIFLAHDVYWHTYGFLWQSTHNLVSKTAFTSQLHK